MRIVFRYSPVQDIVDAGLKMLRERSPVGEGPDDEHPGLYRDSHTVFLNGHVVKEVRAFKRGDQINISNPVPYARKIETARGKLAVGGHVYEDVAELLAGRYGNRVSIKFTYMPVRFGDVASFAAFSKAMRAGRRLSNKAREDWLVRQPAIQIRSR